MKFIPAVENAAVPLVDEPEAPTDEHIDYGNCLRRFGYLQSWGYLLFARVSKPPELSRTKALNNRRLGNGAGHGQLQ